METNERPKCRMRRGFTASIGHRIGAVAVIAFLAGAGPCSAWAAQSAANAFQDVRTALGDSVVLGALPPSVSLRTPDDLLTSVQQWLIWTGFYNGTVDGALGDGTLEAIRKYQRSLGTTASGVLTLAELRGLAGRGAGTERDAGFALHLDGPTGVRLGIPKKLLSSYRTDGRQSRFESPDGRASVVLQSIPSNMAPALMLDVVLANLRDVSVSYSASRKNWFVIAGSRGSRQIYLRFQRIGDYFSGFAAQYDNDFAPQISGALTMMSLTLDTQTPNPAGARNATFEMVVKSLAEPAPVAAPAPAAALPVPPRREVVDAKPLAQLRFDGTKPASMTFRDLSVTMEAAAVKGDPDGKDPVARLAFADGRKVELKIADHARDEPVSEIALYELDRSTAFPQAVMTYFWGGAHCCTVTRIVTFDSDRKPVVIEAETLDGDGYAFRDIDGDGSVELLSSDNSFHYAFASYAESVAPVQVWKLKGAALANVTLEASYRQVVSDRLAEIEALDREQKSSNGYWAGWVATKAQLGAFREAWTRMLSSYDRDTTWTMQECLDGPLRDCPDSKLRNLQFPEALARHLQRTGYISQDEMREALLAAQTLPPAAVTQTSSLATCVSAKNAVRRLVLGQLTGKQITAGNESDAVTARDDFAVDALDDKIGKTLCSATVDIDLRGLVAELAGRSEMRAAAQLSQLASRKGAQLNRRVTFTVQPTSKPGQTWVTIVR